MLQAFNSTKVARFGAGSVIARSVTGFDDGELRNLAPAVFAGDKHNSRSERYAYIPTSDVLTALRNEGFKPFEVRQGGSRDDAKKGFTKHMLRLRHATDIEKSVGENIREVILLNSHDGTSSYQLMSGVFRIVCANGLIACESEGQMIRIPHKGDVVSKVIEGSYQVLDESKLIEQDIQAMQSVQLSNAEQGAFAEAALQLRYAEDSVPDVNPHTIIAPRRSADVGNDLWKTFNRAQENLIKGGQHYVHTNDNGMRSSRRMRSVNGIDGNVNLNRALWTLSAKMAELKQAA